MDGFVAQGQDGSSTGTRAHLEQCAWANSGKYGGRIANAYVCACERTFREVSARPRDLLGHCKPLHELSDQAKHCKIAESSHESLDAQGHGVLEDWAHAPTARLLCRTTSKTQPGPLRRNF